MSTSCHCGNKESFEICCEPIIKGKSSADSAETLMRARYSAYVICDTDFLHDSLHPDGRDDFDADTTRQWAESSEWLSLQILDTKAGRGNDSVGNVDFIARYKDSNGTQHQHCERSHFKRVNGEWLFCDGQTIVPPAQRVGRNDPCPCGSGKKYKKCCNA